MSFYKQTWMMMDEFSRSVERIRNQNTKIGTILVETLSLKKYLAELPKKIVDSIRSNVTNTMETETKSLREELSKTSEILDQLPGSLNVYVEQVNTLKYVKEKQEEFS
jgi:predicted transcriptional regulator